MDRNFNPENFEESLKAYADQFRMAPSKKVWHGIYNDLHPGTRWPSVAMSLVFIFTLVIIGHLNTNNSQVLAALNSAGKSTVPENTVTNKKIKTRSSHPLSNSAKPFNNNNVANDNPTGSIAAADEYVFPSIHKNEVNSNLPNSDFTFNDHPWTKFNSTNAVISSDQLPSLNKDNDIVTKNEEDIFMNGHKVPKENITQVPVNISNTDSKKAVKPDVNKTSPDGKQTIRNSAKEGSAKQEEKLSGSSFLSKKVRDKISINYYVSPSVSYRSLVQKSFASNSNQNPASATSIFSNSGINSFVTNKSSIGMEVGAALNYKISKRWQATTGLQLNYTGYHIKANYVHPVQTSLLLISDFTGEPYAFNSISTYGNATGSGYVTLHQYSFQASAPFGLKYMIAGNNNIQFNAGATLQPSYVIANKSYLLSADRKNYVNEPSLVRTFNMTTNFGTFVSFKSNSFNWEIGPQVFYQAFSTYAHNYPSQEHLVNYGIRFGVSKLKK